MTPLQILLVEDDAMIGSFLAEVLAGMGHACSVATTEADAVMAASRDQPDLMIVDLRLGDGSGIAAVEKILVVRPIPHVFVSGDPAQVSKLRSTAVVLQKPFREADLTRAIHQALAKAVR